MKYLTSDFDRLGRTRQERAREICQFETSKVEGGGRMDGMDRDGWSSGTILSLPMSLSPTCVWKIYVMEKGGRGEWKVVVLVDRAESLNGEKGGRRRKSGFIQKCQGKWKWVGRRRRKRMRGARE